MHPVWDLLCACARLCVTRKCGGLCSCACHPNNGCGCVVMFSSTVLSAATSICSGIGNVSDKLLVPCRQLRRTQTPIKQHHHRLYEVNDIPGSELGLNNVVLSLAVVLTLPGPAKNCDNCHNVTWGPPPILTSSVRSPLEPVRIQPAHLQLVSFPCVRERESVTWKHDGTHAKTKHNRPKPRTKPPPSHSSK